MSHIMTNPAFETVKLYPTAISDYPVQDESNEISESKNHKKINL